MIKHRLTNTDEKESAGVHPADGRLADFMNGRLDEAESSVVESHLAKCPRCVDSLTKLEKREDRFIGELVSAAEPTFEPTEAPTSTAKNASSDTPSSGSFPRQPPQQVGRFQILDQIGQGGFGIVMRAYDPNLQRDVALKVPRFELFVDVELRARFLREAQAAAALEHQGIVSIYEAGEESGICYIASALCRGPDLASWLKQQEQPLPARTTAKLIGSLAAAVHHAHIRGVLHRDLKPSNVLLDPVEEISDAANSHAELPARQLEFPFIPKISDFGLAKFHGTRDTTMSNVVMGTAAYMSPEQARGRMKLVGPASDIYSLGAVLYELLTGRPPNSGETELETLQRVQREEPIPPTRLRPQTPRDLELISLKCLEKEPHRRYGTAKELADDLERFLDGRPIHARPVGVIGRSRRWCGRNPVVAALTACLLATLLLIAVGSSAVSLRLADEVRLRTGAERQSKQHLWESYLASVKSSRSAKTAGRRFGSLEVVNKAVELGRDLGLDEGRTLQLRDEAIACLALADMHPPDELQSLKVGGTKHLAIDANLGRVVWTAADNSSVIVGSLDGTAAEHHLETSDGVLDDLEIDSNGRFIAGISRQGDQSSVFLWDLDSNKPTEAQVVNVEHPVCCTFDSSGGSLAIATEEGLIWIFDPATSSLTRSVAVGFKPAGCSGGGAANQIVTWAGSRIAVVDLARNKVIRELKHRNGIQVQSAALSTDGEWLVSGCSNHLAYAWHLDQSQPEYVLKGHQGWVTHVAFNVEGDLVATSSSDGTTRLWEYWTGRELVAGYGYGLRFSQDGKRLAVLMDSSVRLFQVSSGQRRTGRSSDAYYETYGYAAGPDSRFFASYGTDGTRFWDYSTAKQIGWLDTGFTYWLQWRRSGGQLQLLSGSDDAMRVTPIEFDAASGVRTGETQPIDLPPTVQCSHRPSLSADQKRLAFVSGDGNVYVLNLDRDTKPLMIQDNDDDLAALSADGRWLATYAHGRQGVDIWSVDQGQRVASLLPSHTVAAAAFSPDGGYLVVDAGDSMISLEPGSWNEMGRVELGRSAGQTSWESDISFTADGKLLAVSSAGFEVKLLRPTCDRVLASLPTEFPRASVCLNPLGSHLVCTGPDMTLQSWDLTAIHKQLASIGSELLTLRE